MFREFCTALALECVLMKHGRGIVLGAVMEDYAELVVAVISAENAPPSEKERLH